MARLNARVSVLLIACVSGFMFGQAKPTFVQQKSEKSVCANIVALTGNVDINCSNLSVLTPAQKKGLADIPAILKMALTNQNYLDAILEKMNAMAQPVTVNNAPGGFAVSGGTVINPQVTNLGPPPAQIEVGPSRPLLAIPRPTVATSDPSWDQQRRAWIDSLGLERFSSDSSAVVNPGLTVEFHVSEPVPDPDFRALCDQLCVITEMQYEQGSRGTLSTPAVLTSATTVVMFVRSLDPNKPVTRVTPIFAKDAPSQ
jgi:hypothetical protein